MCTGKQEKEIPREGKWRGDGPQVSIVAGAGAGISTEPGAGAASEAESRDTGKKEKKRKKESKNMGFSCLRIQAAKHSRLPPAPNELAAGSPQQAPPWLPPLSLPSKKTHRNED